MDPLKEPKEEPLFDDEEHAHFAMPSLSLSSFLLPRAPIPMNVKEEDVYPDAELKEEIENEVMLEDSPIPIEREKRRKSSMIVKKGNSLEDSDGEKGPAVKKSRPNAHKSDDKRSVPNAGEAQSLKLPVKLNVQPLENFLEKYVVDGARKNGRELELEKKVSDLTNQLYDQETIHLRLQYQLRMKVKILTNQLEVERKNNRVRVNDFTNQLKAQEAKHLAYPFELEMKVKSLTNQLEEERNSTRESTLAFLERITELTSRLARYEGKPQPPPLQQSQQKASVQLPPVPKSPQTPRLQQSPQQSSDSSPPRVPQQPHSKSKLKMIEKVSIRAKFSDISMLSGEKAYSPPIEFCGIIWKLCYFYHKDMSYFSLDMMRMDHDKLPYPRFTVDFELNNEKSDISKPIRGSQKEVDPLSRSQGLTTKSLMKLEDLGYVIDDSILITVVIRAFAHDWMFKTAK